VISPGFACFALILAALVIYGAISYSVSQRTQEIGIRMALGCSWILSQTLSGLLFGVTAADPITFGSMLAVITSVAVMAGYLPARRASRIDPMMALRVS
jgi:ABC-type antimicrobial peptide transport system permease subunit